MAVFRRFYPGRLEGSALTAQENPQACTSGDFPSPPDPMILRAFFAGMPVPEILRSRRSPAIRHGRNIPPTLKENSPNSLAPAPKTARLGGH